MGHLTTLFWNIWFDNQDGTRDDGTKLAARLTALIEQHQPDVIGLNEVLATRNGHKSAVIKLLQRQRYEVHFSPVYEHSDHSIFGNVFATKCKVKNVMHHIMEESLDISKRHQYYVQSQMIEAHIKVGRTPITVFVTHLSSIWPRQWPTHLRQRKAYERLIDRPKDENVIIGGDFNEFRHMNPWFKHHHYRQLTGTSLKPTWRWRGQRRRVLQGNLDRILFSTESKLVLEDFQVLDRKPSDHAPLLARFKIK